MTKTILIIFGSIFVNTICFADMTDYELGKINSHLEAIEDNQQQQQRHQRLQQQQLIMLQEQREQQEEQRKLQEQQYQQQHPQMLPSIQNGRLIYTPAQ